jgi:hypothetical protein
LAQDSGELFDELILAAYSSIDIINGQVVRSVNSDRLINAAAPLYKHASFSEEREWRFTLSRNINFDHLPNEDFRVGKSTLIPFIPVSLDKYRDQAIREVIIGPTPNMDLSVRALRQFINSKEMVNVSVRPSIVPYRPW